MMTVAYFEKLDANNATAEVLSYGRRWGVVVDEGKITVRRNEDSSYDRTPKWKIKADIANVEKFAKWAMA